MFSIDLLNKNRSGKYKRHQKMRNDNIELADYNSSITSSSNNNYGAKLIWRNVSVFAKTDVNKFLRKKTLSKRIIHNSTGCVNSGVLLAVMGASGAGKSTLMSTLAHRNAAGTTVEGDILVNNRPVGPFMHRLSGFVHQDDLFNGALTVLEHITFMANLRLDRRLSKSEKCKLVEELLGKLGLMTCIHTRIGHSHKGKTLSGGEKKRLSFASELITKPPLLFCDEPTTGLDAYGAQQLVRILQSLAEHGTTILCTIHQPSSQVFAMFHQVLFLAEGRTAFMGRPDEAVTFFADNGFQCPSTYNPADYIIGTLATTGHMNDPHKFSDRICDAYAASQILETKKLQSVSKESLDDDQYYANQSDFRKPLWILTILWLIHRNFLIVCRDPSVQALRIVQKIGIAIMIGLCFNGTIDLTQHGIQSVQGALFVLISENTFTPMYSVLALFPQGFPLFIRERRSGLYDTMQYYLSQILALIPGLLLEPLLFAIIGYWSAGLRPTAYAFAMTTLISVFVINVATACGCLFSIAFNSVPVAIAYLVPFDVSLMITSGAFLRLTSIPVYLSWLKYLSWMMYANEAMTIVQWDGVQNITCTGMDPRLPCLRDANDIYDQYSFESDHLDYDLWMMFLLYTGFNSLAFIILWIRTKRYC